MDEVMLEEIKRQLRRKASRMILGGFRPSEDPFVSWFGRVRVARPDEAWPEHEGNIMAPLCQMNLLELPYVPEKLRDIALITLFIDPEDLPIGKANGRGWELRAYRSLDGLVETVEPDYEGAIKPFPIRWELIEEDYPCLEDIPIELQSKIEGDCDERFENSACSKVGGWPSIIQGEVDWGPKNLMPGDMEFVLQINSEEKAEWIWGDEGIGYFGLGSWFGKDEWALDWQCF
ncbi:MAG: DUF1963 domain-containing protein [Planctomycetota bacterium]|jgi:uncharacterized protein YwqG